MSVVNGKVSSGLKVDGWPIFGVRRRKLALSRRRGEFTWRSEKYIIMMQDYCLLDHRKVYNQHLSSATCIFLRSISSFAVQASHDRFKPCCLVLKTSGERSQLAGSSNIQTPETGQQTYSIRETGHRGGGRSQPTTMSSKLVRSVLEELRGIHQLRSL